jgi:anti-anti-sigma factor
MSDARQVFTIGQLDGGQGFVLTGELDISTVSELTNAFSANGHGGEVTLDLSGLTFIDSSGLHAIAAFARSRGPEDVVVTGVSPTVFTLFEITQLEEIPNLRIHVRA